MAYATAEELRLLVRHPVAFSADEESSADLLLELAKGVIEEETGQALESSTDTVILDGPTSQDSPYQGSTGSKKLILPRWPVTAVTSVTLTEDDELLTFGKDQDYTWSAAGILHRRGAYWPCHDRAVEVVYTAGFTTIPPSLKRMQLRLAAAGWSNPEFLAGETLGDHSRQFSAEALGMELTKGDIRALGAYRART